MYDRNTGSSFVPVCRWSDGLDSVTLDQINEELGSVAVSLKSLRNKLQCSCSQPFEHYSRRVSHI